MHLAAIAGSLDGLGINYYNPTWISAPAQDAGLPFEQAAPDADLPLTAFGWPVAPDGLRDLLVGLRERYGDALPPLAITENGCSYPGLDDQERIAFLDGHLRAVEEAAGAGVDVRGYFVWTLVDNFEWAEGYHQTFGLVHLDHATRARTPKASFTWYRDRIRAHRAAAAV